MKEFFFTLAHPSALLIFLILPILYYFRRRQQKSQALAFSSLVPFRDLKPTLKQKSSFIPNWLIFLALTCLIIALARPQWGFSFKESISEGVDIMLSIDTSGSMKALDFHVNNNESNRLDVIKEVLNDFIPKRQFDRIGIIVFGDESFTQAPLTTDTHILTQLITRMQIGMAGDGTAIGNGLALAVKRLKNQKTKSKIIILLTDGRNNAGDISTETATELAQKLGIKVYTIGVGSQGPVPYPEETPWGIRKVYAKLDLDEETLQNIAKKTNGRYFRATDTAQLEEIYNEIDRLEKTEIQTKEYREVNEFFPAFILIGLLSLILAKALEETFWFKLP